MKKLPKRLSHTNSSLDPLSNRTIAQQQSIEHYIEAATSDNTRRAYQADIRHFIHWGGLLPTSADIVLRYLQQHAEILNARTLKRRLVALRHWHVYQGFSDPTSHPSVRKTLMGILRLHGKPPEKAPPISLDQLMQINQYLKACGRVVDIRNNALLQIGFFGAFRRSELVAILWEHVTFVEQGVEILIPRSKTDPDGMGSYCAIPYGNHQLCPVIALQAWRNIVPNCTGPVFSRINQQTHITEAPLAAQKINTIIKMVAHDLKFLRAHDYSGHSLRRGFATVAAQKGASLDAIMRQGRWVHEGTVHGYIEEGQRFASNAANAVLSPS